MKALKFTLQMLNKGLSILLFIVFFAVIVLVVSNKFTGGDFQVFGYELKTVLSGSMEPDIMTGSVIAIKMTDDGQQFEKGDVITFRAEEHMLITHRITEVIQDGQAYRTKGDANNAPDQEPVPAENIVGQYTGVHLPYVGYVLSFAGSKEGAALLMVLPGLFLLGYAFFSIGSVLRQIDDKKEEQTAEEIIK